MVTVTEVLTKKDSGLFLDFPLSLYKDNPYYVPQLRSDDVGDWDKKKNPAFSYCEVKRFLAWQDGKVVGRIGAILSHRSNERWGTNRMRFTCVDFIDDEQVSSALFAAVEAFAAEKGCAQVHGPLGFSDLDREGMLVEGFEERGLFYTYYNFPYYNEHLARLGYRKDTDWVEFKVFRPERDSRQAKMLDRLATHTLKKYDFHIPTVRTNRGYKHYIEQAFALVNRAYGHLYSVVELDEKQIRRYAKKFVPLIDPDFTCIVLDKEGNMVAFGATAPNLSRAFRQCKGRLFPFGWIPVLRDLKHNNALDMLLIAVEPKWQGAGLNAIIINYIMKNAYRRGIEYAETGPQLEDNIKIVTQWSMFDKQTHKRRRCYIKDLSQGETNA